MIITDKYNPCEEYAEILKQLLSDQLNTEKEITFLYENKKFYTNIKKEDMELLKLKNTDYEFSQKDLLTINLSDDFYIAKISKCPTLEKQFIGDIYYDGIVKRMFAQIEFGFFTDGNITEKEIDICNNIFKSIYSKSLAIKYRNIKIANKKYNTLQKEGWVNKSIIYGIIYAVYDYCNLNQETITKSDHQPK